MGINLGRRQIAVPQQHLHNPQIGAMVEQMGGKGMTQSVGGNFRRGYAARDGEFFCQVKEALPRHMTKFSVRWKQKT